MTRHMNLSTLLSNDKIMTKWLKIVETEDSALLMEFISETCPRAMQRTHCQHAVVNRKVIANLHFSCILEVMKIPIWIRFDIAGYLSKTQHEMQSSLNWQINLCLSKGQPCHLIGCLFHFLFYLIKFRAQQANIIILQSFWNT